MKIVGGLLIAFGLVDMIGSYTGLDVWGQWLHIELPELIWTFTAYIWPVLPVPMGPASLLSWMPLPGLCSVIAEARVTTMSSIGRPTVETKRL